jgi:hypothetical protein
MDILYDKQDIKDDAKEHIFLLIKDITITKHLTIYSSFNVKNMSHKK